MLGFLQSHPFMVAWVSESADKVGKDVQVFVECHRGFTKNLTSFASRRLRVIIDGPYGNSPQFNELDKILLISKGIGIAAHLLVARELLSSARKTISKSTSTLSGLGTGLPR